MTRPFHLPLVAALLASTALSAAAQSAATPVRSVVLYESGLAELTRDTGDSTHVQLRVPMRDVNDILKSLLVRGTGISGASIAMDGSDPVGDTFARLPFPPDAVRNLQTLLQTVPGIRITDGISVTGEIVDVGEVCTDTLGCRMSLMVLGDDGKISSIMVRDGGSIQILDEGIVAGMITGLRSLKAAAADTTRDISVTLTGDDVSGGQMSYVVAAPAWKTSYRAITAPDGDVDLQGWAVIENATGEDWSGVTLTLSSGSPVTLQSNLFGRDWRDREEAFAKADAPGAAAQTAFRTMADSAGMMEMSAVAPAPLVADTVMSDSAVESRFALPGAQTVGAGKILSTPFLTDNLQAGRVVRWRGDHAVSVSPDLVLTVQNDLPVRLPAGVVTISDPDTGFVGDARMPIVAPGDTVDVVYGTDRHIDVDQRSGMTETATSITVAKGMIRITGKKTRNTTYTVTAHSGDASSLRIDHPDSDGWTAVAKTADGATIDATRDVDEAGRAWLQYVVPLASTDGITAMSLTVVETRPTLETVAFGSMDAAAFLSWSSRSQDPVSKAFLAKAASLSEEIDDASARMNGLTSSLQSLDADQARTRANLSAAADGTPAHNRFMETLVDLEDRITAARDAQDAAAADLAAARAALADHLTSGL